MTGRAPAAVLFDLDGTLVDTSPLWRAAYQAQAHDLGVSLPDGWWDAVRGRSLTDSLAVFGSPGQAMHDTSGARLEASLVAHAERRLASVGVSWLPGARDLVTAVTAAGIPTAVVTATWRGLAEVILARGGVAVPVVGGDEVMRGKPAPDGYLLAARRLGVEPRSCLAVEDSATGVAAAEAAGMRVVAVASGEPLSARPGVSVVRSLTELDADDPGGWLD